MPSRSGDAGRKSEGIKGNNVELSICPIERYSTGVMFAVHMQK